MNIVAMKIFTLFILITATSSYKFSALSTKNVPRFMQLYAHSEPNLDEHEESSFRKQFISLLASAVTLQMAVGNPSGVLASNDPNFDAITDTLIMRLGKEKVPTTIIETVTPESVTKLAPAETFNFKDSLDQSILQINELKFDREAVLSTLSQTFNTKIMELRNFMKDFPTDWKNIVCALFLLSAIDSRRLLEDYELLTQEQRDEIIRLNSTLSFFTDSNLQQINKIDSIGNTNFQSSLDLQQLSNNLILKTNELEDLKNSLQEIQDLDEQIISTLHKYNNNIIHIYIYI